MKKHHATALTAAMLVGAFAFPESAQAWESCFNNRQNQIVGEFQSRVNGAVGICQQGRVSIEMWQAVERAARECGAPAYAINEIQTYVQQSRDVANASCS